jgi:hypothetical protein
MRVTKKFSGTQCIGKSVFCPCEPTPDNIELLKMVNYRLAELERDFRVKVRRRGGIQRVLHYRCRRAFDQSHTQSGVSPPNALYPPRGLDVDHVPRAHA